jgi:hypothetical protein
MFANGGQAVPNEYKGFSKLPEEVQMKMDPVAAKKYEQGGVANMSLQDYLGDQAAPLAAEAQRLGISVEELLALLNQSKQEQPVGMAMGGDPAMAQGVGSMMPPEMSAPPAMPAAPPPMEGGQAIDPQVLEGALATAEQEITNLDQAEDFETVMNTIRGDEATVEERYEELAGVVGEEDARQTPESVLTLVQPAMVMGAVDQGIGGLAQEEMTQPVQGAMAQGIMSTVAPPQPPAGMGGPPPVNFNQGGLVRRGDNQPVKMMQAGGDPFANVPGDLGQLARERMAARQGIIGDPSARIQQQEDLTKSQMLFDIANTALAFAAPMEDERPGMSAAERLAMAARTTQLPQTIGARAAKLGEFKTGLDKEKQALQLAALGSAETALAAKTKAAADERKAALEAGYRIQEIMLKQVGEMELAQNQANWKASLQDDQQLAAQTIERLRQAGDKESIRLSKQLEKQNAIATQLLKGEQALEQIGLRGMNTIAAQDKAHVQALQIQENNQKLSRELKDIDVQMKSIDQAIAMEDQNLKEADMLQRAAIEANKQVLENKKLKLKEREVLVKEAATGLDKFGKGLEGKLLSQLTNVEKLKLYETGDLGEQETADLEASMLRYTDMGPVFDETIGKMVIKPARKLPDRVVRAREARDAAGFRVAPLGSGAAGADATDTSAGAATTATTPAATADTTTALGTDITQQDVGAIPTGDDISKTTYSDLLDGIDVSDAFGAPTAFGEFLNRGVEFVSLGTAQAAPAAAESRAIIDSINQNATLIYLEAVKGKADKELRKEIQSKLPEPAAFTKGEKSALNKAKSTVAFLNSKIDPIELELQGSPKGADVGKRRNALASLKAVRDTYAKLADKLEAVVDPKPKPPRSDAEVADDLFGG